MDLLTPSSPGGLSTLSLTTNSSWLPWGRVAMPPINPLMPVPQYHIININFVKDSNHFYSLGGSCSQNLQLLCQDMAKHAQTDNIAL